MRIDHIVIGVKDLATAAARVEASYGLRAHPDQNRHPGGTINRNIPLAPPSSIELLAADPGSAGASWLDPLIEGGDRIIGWAIDVDDIDSVAERTGETAIDGGVELPDGTVRTWRRVGDIATERPWYIAYGLRDRTPIWQRRYEEVASPARPGAIAWIEVGGDEGRLQQWLGECDLPIRFVGGPPGVRAVGISSPEGVIVLPEFL